MKKVKLHDKEFELLIDAATIDQAIAKVANEINKDPKDTKPLFLSILNGSCVFTSDL